jgi:hypothetical protein
VPAPVAPAAAPAQAGATLPPRWRWAAVAIFAAGLALSFLPLDRLAETPRYGLHADRALAAADAFLRTQQVDPAAYRHFVFPTSDAAPTTFGQNRRPAICAV